MLTVNFYYFLFYESTFVPMNNFHIYISVVVFMVIGTIIYIFFRTPVLFTIPFISGGTEPLIPLTNNIWSYALKYVVPDILWCISLLLYATTIHHRILRILAVSTPPFLEISQLFKFIPGTFDIIDLTAYIIITIIFITRVLKPYCI